MTISLLRAIVVLAALLLAAIVAVVLFSSDEAHTVDIVATIAGIGVPVIGGLLLLLRELAQVHTAINSRMDNLLDSTRAASHAEGHAAGIAAERARTDHAPRTREGGKR